MNFEEDFKRYLVRLQRMREQLKDLTEEATKNALIMPFFSMLGYDVFDTTEFLPEYVCDFSIKKGEKIDYAVLKDGEPIMMIEVKRAGMKLQKQQQGQLYRYFSTNHCRVAILTNGVNYLFFSDLNAPNIMDDEPFLSFNLLEDDYSDYLSALEQFHKGNFNVKSVISKAIFQKYAKVVAKTLRQDLICPSDEIVKYFLSRPGVKTGNKITKQMIEKYREVTRKAMLTLLGATIVSDAVASPSPAHSFSDNLSSGLAESFQTDSESIPSEPVSSAASSESVETVYPTATDAPSNIAATVQTVVTPAPSEPAAESLFNNDIVNPSNLSVEAIATEIITHILQIIPAGRCQQEDIKDCLRIHIYAENNRKLGIVKILKENRVIQFRKIGTSTTYDLHTISEIKNFLC